MASYADDLGLAHVLADSADSVTESRFRRHDLQVKQKPDSTHVTEADLAAEKALRSTLSRARPRDGVAGEEFDEVAGAGGRRWVIDPIDGTANYVRGVPIWATLIALFEGAEPVVGMISAPALNRRWWAAKDLGAFAGRGRGRADRIAVSQVRRLSDASVSLSSLPAWYERGRGQQAVSLLRQAWRARDYGDFYSYALLAEGAIDAAAETHANLWDLAAPAVVVCEAGGRFTDFEGNPGPGASAVASNGLLHDEVRRVLVD